MAQAPNLQPLVLLSDEPIAGHGEDFLARDDDARTIAGAVLGTTGPMTIGVYGACRQAETYLIKHAKDRRG